EMNERMQHEVLAFEASFRGNRQTGRVELHLCGSGVGLKESGAALDWIGKVLHAPNWRPENLPRIRDVVDQQLAALRSKSQDREENWVRDPSDAWLMQHHPAWLASHSFLTRSYNTLRLRWQLMDPAAPDRNAVTSFLTRLADSGTTLDRPGLKALLKKEEGQCNAPGWSDLSADQKKLAAEALEDLDLSLDEIPDSSLGTDFRQLTLTLCDDLATPVNDVLERLDETRRRLGGARMFLASPQAMRSDLMPKIEAFAGTLDATPFESVSSRAEPLISARLRSRGVDAAPLHVGLRAPNMQGGVIMTAVPGAHFTDSNDKEKLLDYLAAAVYAGFGSHAAFSKTTGEGLAYTSKILFSESQAEMGYYAERTPDLPQTVRFLVDVIKNSQQDDALGEYAIAQAFEASRASPVHEERARSIAADL